jgi:hypothetical protein
MQQTYDRSYNFDSKDPNVAVMARDSSGRWSQTTLGDVRVFSGFTHFYFVDDLEADVPEEEEVEPTAADRAREGVNEMIGWINMWAVKMPAVDAKLNEFRDQIFAAIDELESENDW